MIEQPYLCKIGSASAVLAKASLLACLLLVVQAASAQLIPYPTYAGEEGDQMRLLLLDGGRSGVHAAMQPLTYNDVGRLLDTFELSTQLAMNPTTDVQRLTNIHLGRVPGDTNSLRARQTLTRSFYKTRGYALDLQRPGFRLLLNPVLDFIIGSQYETGGLYFQNTRGITLRGDVDQRVWFQSTITENQARLPSYEREWRNDYRGQVPGVGFFKIYNSDLFDVADAIDYIQATGELGFRLTRHIGFRFGHGNPRLGIGQRSLLLSDFADPFLYAQIDTRVWRIHYRNLYTQLQDFSLSQPVSTRKHMVAHTLSVQVTPRWEVGLTEQTVFRRDNGFDAQYLNPIILYRAVEQDNGSPDNALFGFHSNYLLPRAALYTQFLLDEFKFDELIVERDGWWANKWAWQIGARLIDPLDVNGLDVNLEYNIVRPFTYTHGDAGISYSHYNQPLAHPWGASLREFRLEARQRLGQQWRVAASVYLLTQGTMALGAERQSFGANILDNYNTRGSEYGHQTAEPSPTRRTLVRAALIYRPIPGAAIEARAEYYDRNVTDATTQPPAQQGISLAVRLNAVRREGVF